MLIPFAIALFQSGVGKYDYYPMYYIGNDWK